MGLHFIAFAAISAGATGFSAAGLQAQNQGSQQEAPDVAAPLEAEPALTSEAEPAAEAQIEPTAAPVEQSPDLPPIAPGEKNDHKFFFFQRDGVEESQFVADYGFCGEYAGLVSPPRNSSVYTPNPIAAGVTGFLGGLERGNQRRRMFRAVMRKCMSMKGYARYAIEEEALEELWDGGWDEAQSRVAARAALAITNERRLVP